MDRIETTTVGEAMRGERSFIEVPPPMETVTRTVEAQDYLDGAALRRLHEISDTVEVEWTDGGWHVCSDADVCWTLPTIAEAADACREALTKH